MRNRPSHLCLFLVALGLFACGGGPSGPDAGTNGPTALLVSPTDGRLGETEALVVRFSTGMVPSTLTVNGSLAAAAHTPSWSSEVKADDTLTLTPSNLWPVGAGKQLVLSARDAQGKEATLSHTLEVLETLSAAWSAVPPVATRDTTASFGVTCAPEACALTCALDGAALGACPAPLQYSGLADGEHTLRVVASWDNIQKELQHTWKVDHTPPSVVSARFDTLGEVKVVFDEPIDATAAAQLSNYVLGPDKPAGITVEGTAVSGEVLRLYLSTYQMPVGYSLTLTAQDLAGNVRSGANGTLAGSEPGSRVAFISQARGDGNLRQWSNLPAGANPATGVQAADIICQSEATQAGLAGTFRAFLSDSNNDAACRMLGLDGKLASNCGLAAAPVANTGPWIDTDGQPLVLDHEGLINGRYLSPVSRDATGAPLNTTSIYVWHGTNTSGTSAGQSSPNNCTNWTAGAGSALLASSTQVALTRIPFRLPGNSSCSSVLQGLLCVQVDAGGFPLNARYRRQGKVAFITSTTTSGSISLGGLTGTAAADALCQERATAAGLSNASNFVAWVSTSTTDAYCRVLGRSGKRSDSPACGTSSPPATGPWVTTTGFHIADNLDALVTNGPRIPLLATELETWPTVNNEWTGTNNDGTYSGAGCGDWVKLDAASGGTKGLLPDTPKWSSLGAGTCTDQAHLLCLER